ncbi:Six-hairpin glycosidase [Sordaria brevicollis]|uniref:Six-hairpin glycosidase n=1 Tax=Sordaria brevicollis TaxID=83679 RepID=A0AAE0UBD9_SORBR|nr:Six-hairpin glycosidase [Sordaria brevicollis]
MYVSWVRDTLMGSELEKSKESRTRQDRARCGERGRKWAESSRQAELLPFCPSLSAMEAAGTGAVEALCEPDWNPPVAGQAAVARFKRNPVAPYSVASCRVGHPSIEAGFLFDPPFICTAASRSTAMLVKWTKVALLATAVCAAEQSFLFLPRHLEASKPVDGRRERDYVFNVTLFDDIINAIDVMQEAYFQPWVGTWPSAIDWTAAVLGTHIAGTLETLHRSLEIAASMGIEISEGWSATENTISLYFSQLIGFYFGQNIFALRQEAYDDMLWVVLGWLDATKFIDGYSSTPSRPPFGFGVVSGDGNGGGGGGVEFPTETLRNRTWHGTLWTPAFAHRARIFWELAAAGWDTTLCGGGMNWNPRLLPYKNAITNELYIAASVMMYLHFPGDDNNSPFIGSEHNQPKKKNKKWYPHDPKYLAAAVDAYNWLIASNMTNALGLFTDGFHISGYSSGSNNTKCDERDEMLYTYNQGVILTGQRNLFSIDPNPSYLKAGHTLIQNVIRATGWDLTQNSPVDNLSKFQPGGGELPPWRGLGRAGILEEVCDATGECSQDAQTFKGIWMHHFTAFCLPITQPPSPAADHPPALKMKKSAPSPQFWNTVAKEHSAACQRYLGWLKHNAHAAARTRDSEGKFGMWWTAGLLNMKTSEIRLGPDSLAPMEGVTDYRNRGVPRTSEWVLDGEELLIGGKGEAGRPPVIYDDQSTYGVQHPMTGDSRQSRKGPKRTSREVVGESRKMVDDDPNTRGRGRTVETQSGGLAVLRALWELSVQTE